MVQRRVNLEIVELTLTLADEQTADIVEASLRDLDTRWRAEAQALHANTILLNGEYAQLLEENAELLDERARLASQCERLKGQVEGLEKAAARQAGTVAFVGEGLFRREVKLANGKAVEIEAKTPWELNERVGLVEQVTKAFETHATKRVEQLEQSLDGALATISQVAQERDRYKAIAEAQR